MEEDNEEENQLKIDDEVFILLLKDKIYTLEIKKEKL